MSGPIGIIVEGYSSGAHLARQLKAAGCTLIHVRTNARVLPYHATHDPSLYVEEWVLGCGEPGRSLQRIAGRRPDFVIAGSEPGVIVADALASSLGLPGNVAQLSVARRDKALMLKRVAECGLQIVDQVVAEKGVEAPAVSEDWLPAVVKPAASAASEDVRICHSMEEITRALQHILAKANFMGDENRAALVQKKLSGTQYMVNTVSLGGDHRVIEAWRECRLHTQGGHSLYDYEELISPDEAVFSRIEVYVKAVVSALGVRFGPAHTELFMTDKGPVLLESASRLQGGIDGKAVEDALGYSQISLTRDLLLDPVSFRDISNSYSPGKKVMLVNFISHRAGTVRKIHVDELVGRLPSFHSAKLSVVVGNPIPQTVDLLSKPGHVYLVHESREQLLADYQAIRAFERDGMLFELEAQ
jgi:biotin carboxylase